MTDSQGMKGVGYRYFKVKIGPPTASCCDSPTQRILPECAGVSSSEPLRQHDLATACSRSLRRDTIIAAESWHQCGHAPNHTAGGINMNFFPVGPIVRRSGVFFIRRSFKDCLLYTSPSPRD